MENITSQKTEQAKTCKCAEAQDTLAKENEIVNTPAETCPELTDNDLETVSGGGDSGESTGRVIRHGSIIHR